jgi:hypothetical protein
LAGDDERAAALARAIHAFFKDCDGLGGGQLTFTGRVLMADGRPVLRGSYFFNGIKMPLNDIVKLVEQEPKDGNDHQGN